MVILLNNCNTIDESFIRTLIDHNEPFQIAWNIMAIATAMTGLSVILIIFCRPADNQYGRFGSFLVLDDIIGKPDLLSNKIHCESVTELVSSKIFLLLLFPLLLTTYFPIA